MWMSHQKMKMFLDQTHRVEERVVKSVDVEYTFHGDRFLGGQ